MTDLLDRLKAALADRYAIEHELGSGGMATVYVAHDLKHHREVAVKVLRRDVAAVLGSERFLREIRVTANLSHPHILPLHDSGDAEGLLFYVMPLVEGESLRQKLNRETQLSMEETCQIAQHVASALDYAHRQGVIHRDIKPENILLHEGEAVLADFGIARALSIAGGDRLTETGLSLGTPQYMSPEQASGDRQLDGRSDIYALACVVYEMLVGDPPFTGPTSRAIITRQLVDPPPSLRTVRATVPPEVEDAVIKALAKVPADRFATPGQFVSALESGLTQPSKKPPQPTAAPTSDARVALRKRPWAFALIGVLVVGGLVALWQLPDRAPPARTTGGDPRSVAVLYFDDLTPEKGLEHVAHGLTEGIIEWLSSLTELDVLSRNAVLPYRHANVSLDSLASRLYAGTLVAGNVEAVGDLSQGEESALLRLTVRLIDGETGADVARRVLILPGGDFFAATDSAIAAVTGLLSDHLGEEIHVRERRAETASYQSWALFQQAALLRRDAEVQSQEDESAEALEVLHRADSLLIGAENADPQWVAPILSRGWIASDMSRLEQSRAGATWIERGLEHVERALALADDHPGALALRGTLRYDAWHSFSGGLEKAEQERLLQTARQDLEAAVTADPSIAHAHVALSHVYLALGDAPSAVRAARRAYEEDPYLYEAGEIPYRLFWGSLDLEQFNDARRWCREGARRFANDSRFASCQLWLMVTAADTADVERGWGLFRQLDTLAPNTRRAYQWIEGQILVGGVLARAGLADSARSVLLRARSLATARIDPSRDLASLEAYVRTVLGDHDEAIDLFKSYVAANPEHRFVAGAPVAWWWRELRDHPRFRELETTKK